MPDKKTKTRIMLALAVHDADPPATTSDIEQIADELLEWSHRLKHEFRRGEIAERIARLSRHELELQLATRLAPAACCMQWESSNDAEPAALSDDELRERLVSVETFVERVAA